MSTELHYFDPDSHSLGVNFLSNDYPKYELDGESFVGSIAPVKVIFPTEVRFGLNRPRFLGRKRRTLLKQPRLKRRPSGKPLLMPIGTPSNAVAASAGK